VVSVEARSVRVTARTVWTFARLVAQDSSEGWGEATLEGRSAEVEAAIRAFSLPIELGAVPTDLVQAAAYSAVEQALCDRVALYANINRGTTDRSPAGFAARAAEAAALGFGAIKIAPFDKPQEGYARIAAVADAIAGRAELQVDCHWRFDEARAQEALGECARLGVTWFECPLPETPEHFAAIKRLRGKANAAGMRLAGAEQFIGTAGFRPLLEQGLYDVVMPDVKYAGGLAECLRIAELAARHGVACSLHNPSGPVCHAHSLHASAAMESNERLEYQHGETPRFYEIAPGLAAPVGGSAALPGPINVKG
jgi:galactonate dehydratase